MATPTQFAYRTARGVGVVNAAPVYEPLSGFQRPEGSLRCCVYSPCGRYFAWASQEQVTVIDASVGSVVTAIQADNVYELGFSPLGTFIITWQRPSKDENGDAVKNLKVWRVVDEDHPDRPDQRNILGTFVQKSQTGWNLQYTQDEIYCARVVTNEIQFYESGNLATVWNRLHLDGVTDFAVSPGAHTVAVFVPERKGQPAAVKIFQIPNFLTPVSQKVFFKGDKVQLKWNMQGTSLIVLAQTEVDKSGKSYYGETTLYLLSANGGFDSRIDLDKEGPIHDVTWSPNSLEFGVVYGYMPAKTTIFNTKAVATHHFTLGPRNTILFSPRGRFVLVAGFGNLAGQIDVYDLERDYYKICTIEASNASVCEWSSDGKYLLTATTSPRLRVDNGIRIWHVAGSLIFKEDMQELYHVTWRPQPTSQVHMNNPLDPVPVPHASALAYLGTVKTPSKPAGAYRPPGARGTSTPLAFMREDQGGAAYVSEGGMSLGSGATTFGKPRRREIPGAEVTDDGVSASNQGLGDESLSKAALKNKKKREAKKAKDVADKVVGLTPAEPSNIPMAGSSQNLRRSPEGRERRNHESQKSLNGDVRSRSQHRARTQSQRRENISQDFNSGSRSVANGTSLHNGATAVAPDLTVTSPGGGSPQEKKIRALTKKLRAIDDLKMRRAGGEKLEGTQVRKMDTEDSVRKELESLGWIDT